MPAHTLSFIPFDKVWRMRIDHPYSMLVRDGDMAWSCGQCPLDPKGEVLYPGDLLAQAVVVCDFIKRFLREIGCAASALGRVVAYFVKRNPGDEQMLLQLLRDRLGDDLQIIPVTVPHFYYEGMLLEVDIYASTSRRPMRRLQDEETGVALEVIDAGTLIWTALHVPKSCTGSVDPVIDRLIAKAGLAKECLLADQWFIADNAPRVSSGAEVMADVDDAVIGELTFAKSQVLSEVIDEPVAITVRRSAGHFYVSARDMTAQASLVTQTQAIMRTIDANLRRRGLCFSNVRKSTTYYLAGSSAEELHLNMEIRNAYYAKPGPASTGLPVAGFSSSPSLITVQLLGRIPPAQ
jgi:enamine deaminase RidA (YjgF/YER057c/UK114 family)